MTDREMMEFAAKAAGELTESWYGNAAYFDGVLSRWNPRDDDGASLRLAVALREMRGLMVQVMLDLHGVRVTGWHNPQPNHGSFVPQKAVDVLEPYADHGNDIRAATRRAVLRAAAEIGRAMK